MIVTRGYGAGLGGIEKVVLEGPLAGLISVPVVLLGTLIESDVISGKLESVDQLAGLLEDITE